MRVKLEFGKEVFNEHINLEKLQAELSTAFPQSDPVIQLRYADGQLESATVEVEEGTSRSEIANVIGAHSVLPEETTEAIAERKRAKEEEFEALKGTLKDWMSTVENRLAALESR